MIETTENSRRQFLEKCFSAGGVLLTGTLLLGSCGQNKDRDEVSNGTNTPVDSCDDLKAVGESDIAVREKLGYVQESPIADNQCHNCNLYLPPKTGQNCGGCMLFKGPVYAAAYCTYWAPKVEG